MHLNAQSALKKSKVHLNNIRLLKSILHIMHYTLKNT